MTTATTINSFLYRMQQDPTILMLDELANLSGSAWQNFLVSLSNDVDGKTGPPVDEKQIYEGLKEFNGERYSSRYSNGSDEPVRISYVKFATKKDLTFFMLMWAS
jgi:hypothetical protein